MNRRAVINRGDLLRCFALVPEAEHRVAAELCGFARAEVAELPPMLPPSGPPASPAPLPSSPPVESVPETAASVGSLELFFAARAATYKPDETVARGGPDWLRNARPFTEEDLAGTGEPPPPTPPLQSWARLWPWLRKALGAERESHRLDTRELLREAARLRPFHRLPRRRVLCWAGRATVLLDRRDALSPFVEDMNAVVRQLGKLRGTEGLDCLWLLDGTPSGEARRFRDGQPCSVQPAPGVPVLVLSDLGNLSRDARLTQVWRQQARFWLGRGNSCAALLPCPRDRWDIALARHWRSACWDRGEKPPSHGGQAARAADPHRPDAAGRLLNWLAPAVRVEPGLLRSLRLRLSAERADVGTEFDVWHHADAARTPFAMALKPAASVRRQAAFAKQSAAAKAAVADLLRRFHAGCGPAMRHREILNLHASGGEPPARELAEAVETQARLVATMFHQARRRDHSEVLALGLYDWMRREVPRLPTATRETQPPVAAGWALVQFMAGGSPEAAPDGISPDEVTWVTDLLLADPGEDTLWEVRLQGVELRLRPWQPATVTASPRGLAVGAPLAWLRVRRPRLNLLLEAANGEATACLFLPRQEPEIRWPIGSARRLVLSSDCGEVTLEARPKPDWASRFGQDQAGLFAEFELDGARFRLRWIPPGSFLMGSPESEAGRIADETLHRVTISRGFWLADTPCTQAQWQAVMGENPSHFKEPYDPKRPVESVDWEQCRQFCARLAERIRGLDFRLPTEAEWEYACRAGTTSAFNDGSNCTMPAGQDPALARLGWYDQNSQDQTHPVAEKRANAWGLHDMHGNVWEWCADHVEITGRLGTDTYVAGIVDPVNQQGAGRIVRGGSVWGESRYCRSASRGAGGPAARDWYRGFRLAAAHPPEDLAADPALEAPDSRSGAILASPGAGRRVDARSNAPGGGSSSPTHVPMSDRPIIVVPDSFPPAREGGWGEDAHGLYAQVMLREVAVELVPITHGEFLMGSPESEKGRREDETEHRVRLRQPFWMGKYPVTQAEYQAVMGDNPSRFKGPRRPVEMVDWHQAMAFCASLTERAREAGCLPEGFKFRLPTEAEWEYACRAGTTSAFNDGSDCTHPDGKDPALDRLGWFGSNSGGETHPVGEKLPNAWGLHDLHGNVLEWCTDHAEWKDRVVTDTYVDGIVDPLCGKGAWRVVRGGSYWFESWYCRSASRSAFGPGIRVRGLGFRLAAGQELPSAERPSGGRRVRA